MERAATYTNLAVMDLYKRYGPVFAFGFGPIRFTWLIGAEANRFILQERQDAFRMGRAYRFLQAIGGDYALITSDEPDHLRRRKMVQGAFQRRQHDSWQAHIETRCHDLTRPWTNGAHVDLYHDLRPWVLKTICDILLGHDTLTRYPQLVEQVNTMMAFANLPFLAQQFKLPLPGTPWGRFVRARQGADSSLYQEIARRHRHPEPERMDVLNMLLRAKDDSGQPLSEQEIRDQAISLVSAGFDTTSAALSWLIYHLLEHPARLEQLQSDAQQRQEAGHSPLTLPYLDRLFKESLRLYPPAPAGLRETTKDVAFAGFHIPAGSLVAFSITLTQRMPEYYRDPLVFKPERWDKHHPEADRPPPLAYLPFGHGARYCIGAGLAEGIIKTTLWHLVQHHRLEPLWQGPIAETGNTVHPKGGLPVRVWQR